MNSTFRAFSLMAAGVLVVAAAFALVACGDDDDDAGGNGDTTNGDAPHAGAAAAVGDISIYEPAARATTTGVTAAYFTIHNHGEADRLVRATSNVTDNVQLHEVVAQDGTMMMREVEGGIELPAGGDVFLKPGDLHVMLLDLEGPLDIGDEIELGLTFEKAGTVALTVPVSLGPGESPGMDHGGDGDSMPDDMNGDEADAEAAARIGDISIIGPAARATQQSVSAVYLSIRNDGAADRLIAAATSISGDVQLHEVVSEDGTMKMQEIEGGIEVPAGGEVVLKPGGLHIMLLDLEAPLELGMVIDLDLTFEKAGTVSLTVPVSLEPGQSPGMSGGQGMGPRHGQAAMHPDSGEDESPAN